MTYTFNASETGTLLQWGRARMSAEMIFLRTAAHSPAELQWGRARMSAEIKRLEEVYPGLAELQWGRARMSAEIPRRIRYSAARETGFNGAALG